MMMTGWTIKTLGASALLLGGAASGVALLARNVAQAGAPNPTALARLAAAEAAKAQTALGAHDPFAAIKSAEAAVAGAPDAVAYRMLLANAYLQAGRFASARQAFADVLSLSPDDPRAALSLALAQIATGDWQGARATLDTHAGTIPVADRGLAVALAGDPASAVELLVAAARTPGADAKTRQNLALSLALAGRWAEARSVAQIDVSPDELDKRMSDWALFARPQGAADQVAALLGVTPVADAGRPVALALGSPRPLPEAVPAPVPAVAAVAPVAGPVAAAEPAPMPPAAPAPAAEPVALAAAAQPAITFGERREIVQALPAPAPAPASAPSRPPRAPRVAVAAGKPVAQPAPAAAPAEIRAASFAKGNFYVQLGAFESEAVARDGWARAQRREPLLSAQTPFGASVKTAAGSFYRLSVGGFARADAAALCRTYRAKGGICFVREGAGEQMAAWGRRKVQLASR